MIAINEYILNRNSKVIKGDSLFKTLDESMEYDKIKELFEKSSYEFVENIKHEREDKNEIRFEFYNRRYIYEQFNLKEKQYLLGFTGTCKFIFAFNPEKQKDNFIGFFSTITHNNGFKMYDAERHEHNIDLKEAKEYLLN
jgi:hypothetical protein